MDEDSNSISLARLLKVLLPILFVALVFRYTLGGYEKSARKRSEKNVLTWLLGKSQELPSVTVDFVDSDGDLLCDPPADDACVAPPTIFFSFVGGPSETDEKETWADLVAALGAATGLPAEYRHYPAVKDQLTAMATGELHVVGLNTGSIPQAVSSAGFHPICTLGKKDGTFGYTMKLLTPARGAQSIAGLKGKSIAFTRPVSISGFKNTMVLLLSEHDMRPDRDYRWGWTYSHETSIQQVAAGEVDAAPVASDILERMVNDGEVKEAKLSVLYESERFPPATIGLAHDLTAELREKIGAALLGFEWAGTSVEAKYGASGAEAFVPVSYKDDWANIRRIDEAIAAAKGDEG